MELLVSDIRRQLDHEWALLGPTATATAFSVNWGSDTKLRLPRMEDALFGVPVHFPEELDELEDGIVDDEPGPESEQDATDGNSSTNNAPTLQNRAERVVGTQVSQGIDAEEKTADPAPGISETSRRDARVSAVEIRGTALQAETSATDSTERQVENMDGQPGKDGDSQLASVLATHSRSDILLELQWARQALRDRRKYLRSKQRVERGPDPCACA